MEILLFNRQVPSFEYVTLSTLESVSESMSRKSGKIYLSRVRSLRTVLYTFQSGKYRNPETHTTLLSSRKRHTFVKVGVAWDVRVVSLHCETRRIGQLVFCMKKLQNRASNAPLNWSNDQRDRDRSCHAFYLELFTDRSFHALLAGDRVFGKYLQF